MYDTKNEKYTEGCMSDPIMILYACIAVMHNMSENIIWWIDQ